MGWGDRNYGSMEREGEKLLTVDKVIDEVKKHEKEIARLEAHIQNVLIHGSDSENLTEKQFNDSIIQNPTNNYFTEKIKLEEKMITDLKTEFKELTDQLNKNN